MNARQEALPGLKELDPIDGFLDWMADNAFKPKSMYHRERIARRVLEDMGTFDVPPRALNRWLADYTGWTKRSYYGALTAVYAWQIEDGHLALNPMNKVPAPPRPRGRPKSLADPLADHVLDTAAGDLRAFILLALYAGLRRHEIAKFRGEHITETTIVVSGKHDVEALIPTHPELWALAQEYPRKGHWFPTRATSTSKRPHISADTVGLAIANHFRACGIENGAVHRLRHTFVTRLSQSGVRMRVVQELARHSSLEHTMLYDAVELAELQAGILKLSFGAASQGSGVDATTIGDAA